MNAEKRRGFSLITLTTILAVMSVGALIFIETIGVDFDIAGQQRRAVEAHNTAEAAVMELMVDRNLPASAPLFTTPGLSGNYSPPASSAVRDDDLGRNYRATLRLVRVAPMLNSSHSYSRALVYEVNAVGEVAGGAHEAEVIAEIYRTVMVSPGTELPQIHAR